MKSVPKVFLSLILSMQAAAWADDRVLSLGAVVSLSGPASVQGNAMKDGVEFAKSVLEESGWKVNVVFEDDGTAPKSTISAVERLSAGGTKFIIGPTWSFLAEASAPVVARTKSIALEPCNSSEFVSGGGGRLFFFLSPVKKQEAVLADWMTRKGMKSAAIVVATSTWGDLHREIFKRAAAKAGVSVTLDESFQYGDESAVIPTLVSKMKLKPPDAILTTTSKEIAVLLVSSLEKQQLKTAMITRDLSDAQAAQLIGRESPFVEGYSIAPRPSELFAAAFKKWKGRNPDVFTDNAYDAVMTLSQAVAAVGSDPENVKTYLETKQDVAGASGRIKFDSKHDVIGADYVITDVVRRTER